MTNQTPPHFLDTVFASSGIIQDKLKMIIPRSEQVTFEKKDYLLKEGQVEKNHLPF